MLCFLYNCVANFFDKTQTLLSASYSLADNNQHNTCTMKFQHLLSSHQGCQSLIWDVTNHFSCMAKHGQAAYNTVSASLAKEHAEGQVCATTGVFRSTLSRLVQPLQSVRPGMPPVTAILPWNNGEFFRKGGKINTPSVDYPFAILGLLAPVVCS